MAEIFWKRRWTFGGSPWRGTRDACVDGFAVLVEHMRRGLGGALGRTGECCVVGADVEEEISVFC